jgi:hypothetical protein
VLMFRLAAQRPVSTQPRSANNNHVLTEKIKFRRESP